MTGIKRFLTYIICLSFVFRALPCFVCEAAAFTGEDKIVIMIDPGHGKASVGTASGNVGEYQKTFELAGYLKEYLLENGSFTVYMTKDSEIPEPSLCERVAMANGVNADLLISIHFDGNPSPSRNGASAIVSVKNEYALDTLGRKILSKLCPATGLKNNDLIHRADTDFSWNTEKQWDIEGISTGDSKSDYYGIPTWGAKFGIPTVIIEHGFMTSPHDSAIILNSGMMQTMARADADAIIEYYTNHTHSYSTNISVDFPSNCVFNGKASYHCTVCRHRKGVFVLAAAPDNHYWSDTQTAATCTEPGLVGKRCVIARNLIERKYTLTPVEEHTDAEIVPALGHDYAVTYHRDVTHSVDGVTSYSCTRCGDKYDDIEKAEGHSLVYQYYAAPTCTEGGGTTYKCSICGEMITEKQPAAGHKYITSNYTEPTCTAAGYKEHECVVCGEMYSETLPPTGHAFETLSNTPATCVKEGYAEYQCTICGEKQSETLPFAAHTYELVSHTEQTCTENEIQTYRCTVCGEQKISVLSLADHSYELISESAATCEENGAKYYKCSRCGNEKTETIAFTGHVWDDGKTENHGPLLPGVCVTTCLRDSSHVRKTLIPPRFLPDMKTYWELVSLAAAITLGLALFFFLYFMKRRTFIFTPASIVPDEAMPTEEADIPSGDESFVSAEIPDSETTDLSKTDISNTPAAENSEISAKAPE